MGKQAKGYVGVSRAEQSIPGSVVQVVGEHRGSTMGRSIRVPRALFGGFVLVGVIWLLCVAIVTDNASEALTTMTTTSTGDFEHLTWTGRENNPGHRRHNLGFHFVSKRRVPNGPDPIHNRRAGKFRQPPGRA